jgi:hypothetical protein
MRWRQGEEKRVKNLFEAGKLLFLDMAATLFFLVLYLLTHNVTLSVVLGMALGAAQIGWQLARGKKIDTMQWMSLFLVLGAGTVTLLTNSTLRDGQTKRDLPRRRHRDAEARMDEPLSAADRARTDSRYRCYLRLRLVGPDVFFRSPQFDRRPQFQRGDVVGDDVDLGHRQQARAVPDRLRHHAQHRRCTPASTDQ